MLNQREIDLQNGKTPMILSAWQLLHLLSCAQVAKLKPWDELGFYQVVPADPGLFLGEWLKRAASG